MMLNRSKTLYYGQRCEGESIETNALGFETFFVAARACNSMSIIHDCLTGFYMFLQAVGARLVVELSVEWQADGLK